MSCLPNLSGLKQQTCIFVHATRPVWIGKNILFIVEMLTFYDTTTQHKVSGFAMSEEGRIDNGVLSIKGFIQEVT